MVVAAAAAAAAAVAAGDFERSKRSFLGYEVMSMDPTLKPKIQTHSPKTHKSIHA